MIIETKEQLDIQNIGIPTESIEASIDTSSMPFLFEMLSSSLYSNPIDSICREITSNCFDSHIEAKVDDPVIVKRGFDEEGYFISFIDVGVGLSPERMQSIYMNYFSSTKRESNDLIGGFGLGSKSPLSYTDYFYINTNFNGIKYQYIFSKGVTIPTLDLLHSESTSNRNGTEIRIYIKDGDLYKFQDALGRQLCYFDNVYFEGWSIDNDYNIFEGEYFKYRNKNQYNSYMHIVLDKVSYPIDWKQLDMKEYNIAVGVKFKIGELLVTPNREQLRYTDETKTLIKDRIKKTIDELITIFDRQNKAFDSFFEWYKNKDSKPFISFTRPNGIVDKLYLYGLDHANKKIGYKYFEGLDNIKESYDILSNFYSCIGEISNGKAKKKFHSPHITNAIINFIQYGNTKVRISNTPYTNAQKDWLAGNGYILYPKSITRRDLRNIFYITNKEYNNSYNKYYFNLGASKKLYELVKAIRKEVAFRCGVYRDLTNDELIAYKEEKASNNTALQRKLEGKVLVNSIITSQSYDWQLKDINRFRGIIIYGFKEDQMKLEKCLTAITQVRSNYFIDNRWNRVNNKIINIVRISKDNAKHFKNKPNALHVDRFKETTLFADMASSFKIEEFFNNIENENGQHPKDYINQMKLICSDIGEVMEEMYKFYASTTNRDNTYLSYARKDIKKDIMCVAEKYNLYNPKIELLFSKVEKWFEGIELIRYVNINEKTLPYILKTLREKKKRLNVEYYQKIMFKDTNKQLVLDFNKREEETITKFNFITKH